MHGLHLDHLHTYTLEGGGDTYHIDKSTYIQTPSDEILLTIHLELFECTTTCITLALHCTDMMNIYAPSITK